MTVRLIVAGLVAAGSAARAGGPIPMAIVEEIKAASSTVRALDYVVLGQEIDLGDDGRMVIGYFSSCLVERIDGGRVKIGSDRSWTEGSRVERSRVECDGGRLDLRSQQAGKGGVVVFREAPGSGPVGAVRAAVRIFSTAPLIKLSGPGDRLKITRLDAAEAAVEIAVDRSSVDLAKTGHRLRPGGLYRAQAGDRHVVFRVDPLAGSDSGPDSGSKPGSVVGRFVGL